MLEYLGWLLGLLQLLYQQHLISIFFYFEGEKKEERESIFLDGVHAWAKTDLISPPFCGRYSPSSLSLCSARQGNLYSNLFSQYQIRLRFNVHSMTMMMKHELTFGLEGFVAVSHIISMKNDEAGERDNILFSIPPIYIYNNDI